MLKITLEYIIEAYLKYPQNILEIRNSIYLDFIIRGFLVHSYDMTGWSLEGKNIFIKFRKLSGISEQVELGGPLMQ